MKKYDVKLEYSYTIDYLCWTCPKCGELNERTQMGDELFICEDCGLELENATDLMGDCDGIEETAEATF